MSRYRMAALFVAVAALGVPAIAQVPNGKPVHGAWGVDLTDQDRSVRPGDNFAMYQSGGWFKRTELKPTQNIAAYWRDVRSEGLTRVDEMMASVGGDSGANPDRS